MLSLEQAKFILLDAKKGMTFHRLSYVKDLQKSFSSAGLFY
ncbi:hypothetical protein FTV88_2519 [Heliorestis convoluta]|uniref:Uncharacterized protein n=1 Tax=Heliorestis convoluta TaxID=356322 RepID=A0A5Q2N5K4_9FIRM|nr:hypothetical protein FTV88_2519 [Heliorestis convoluta]